MARCFRYLTHPQVQQDPDVPVPQWGLSALGRERLLSVGRPAALGSTRTIVSSAETKALETAEVFAQALGLPVITRERMHENDRSATGYLAPPEFEATANLFFAEPDASVRGWERARDAQARIVAEVEAVLAANPGDDILFVGHGAVGTLLYCHFAKLTISRVHDQPTGGGNYFSVRDGEPLHAWRPIESIAVRCH